MASIPKKVIERLFAGIKRFQPILSAAKARDINEADTVTIIKDMLSDVFGYDKYSELTSEHAIRGTYCDLATKIDGALQTLVEIKAIGLELKEQHIKQAVDYAANQGVDWVLLTNGICWKIFRLTFSKPIVQELVVDIDFLSLNPRSERDLEHIYLWCKEGMAAEYFSVVCDVVVDASSSIRKELRKISPDVRIDQDQIKTVLINEVIKREVLEGEKADEAKKKISRVAAKAQRAATAKTTATTPQQITDAPDDLNCT